MNKLRYHIWIESNLKGEEFALGFENTDKDQVICDALNYLESKNPILHDRALRQIRHKEFEWEKRIGRDGSIGTIFANCHTMHLLFINSKPKH